MSSTAEILEGSGDVMFKVTIGTTGDWQDVSMVSESALGTCCLIWIKKGFVIKSVELAE